MYVATTCAGNTRSRVYTTWKSSYVATTCTSIFELAALVSGFRLIRTDMGNTQHKKPSIYNLEIVVCGHHVYKYIWTRCLGERLSLNSYRYGEYARLVSYCAVSVIKMRDGGPHTENHLLCHDCCFRVTPSAWKLRIARYRCVVPLYKAHPHNKGCVIRDKTMRLTDEYALNSEVCLKQPIHVST